MKMKSLILIFIALGCGLVASIGISQVMSQKGGSSKVEMEQILVAKDAIDQNKKLDANMVQFEEWPKQKIPEGAIRKLEEAEGKFTVYRFFKGEPILALKINDKPTGVVTTIPQGFRVTPVKVDEDTVMEAISPGDTVDVNVFLEQGKNGITETGVFTILRNVRVFAKGGNTERTVDENGKEVKARTVSLLVKPEQARELFLAYRLGKISLALRPQDAKDDEVEENVTSMSEILAAKGSNANEQQSSSSGVGSGTGLGGILGGFGGATPAPTSLATNEMLILDSKGGSRFTWTDPKGTPVETKLFDTTGNGSSAPGPAAQNAPAASPASGGVNSSPDPAIPQ